MTHKEENTKTEEDLVESQDEATTEIIKEDEVIEEDYKHKYLSALAELENFRKRSQRDKEELVKFSVENSVATFIPVIDQFELALSSAENSSEETKNWAKGFEMLLAQFKEILLDHNMVSFHSEGNIFNPHEHEAVDTIQTNEFPENTIVSELSKGYKCGSRIVRPAKVKVAKPLKKIGEKDVKKSE